MIFTATRAIASPSRFASRRTRVLLLGLLTMGGGTSGWAQTTVQPSGPLADAASGASAATAASAAPPIKVIVGNRPIDFGAQGPIQSGGRTLVPLRAIFEALGASVAFTAPKIQAKRGNIELELTLGSPQALVNNQPYTLEVPPQAIFGRTLVPLRFVGEAFGAGVSFNAQTQTVTITPPAGAGGGDPTLPYTVPGQAQSVSGTLQRLDTGPLATLSLTTPEGQAQNFSLAPNVLALRQISLAATPGATPNRQPARPVAPASLGAGDEVRLTLDGQGRVTQIFSTATVLVARVQFAGGDQIILDDARDTTISLNNITYIDQSGRPALSANLGAGQSVALFLSRANRAIYRVSAYAPDYTVAANVAQNAPDPLPEGSLPPANAPQISLVRHNARAPLKAGSKLDVDVRATSGQRLSFSLGTKIQVPLIEVLDNPGNYAGSYTARPGDDVLDARILVRLTGNNGFETTRQSEETVTIDTIAPRLIGSFPADGARLNVSQPNIALFVDDVGGSGLGSAKMELLTGSAANPTRVQVPITIAPPTSVNGVAPQALAGLVTVRAVVADQAGNTLPVNLSFTVGAGGLGNITSFSHGSSRAQTPGEEVPLELRATPAGRATFNVLNGNGQVLFSNLPMIEDGDTPGRYRASYRIPDNATGQLRLVGQFDPGDGTVSSREATVPVQIVGVTAPVRLVVNSPRDGAVTASPLVVSGTAAPGALVNVQIAAQGTQLYIFEYNQDLGTQQVRANERGEWQTQPVNLAQRRDIAGLRFTITATQTDAANRESEPVTLTVRAR